MTQFQSGIIRKRQAHSKVGSNIAELPPALILLLMMAFFPFMNFLYLCVAFGAGWYLNVIEARQIACMPPVAILNSTPGVNGGPPTYSASTTTAVNNLPQSVSWNNFMGVTETTAPTVSYLPVSTGSTSSQIYQAEVTTTVSIKPFLNLDFPWLPKIIGVNEAPVFVFTNRTYQDEQTPAPPSN